MLFRLDSVQSSFFFVIVILQQSICENIQRVSSYKIDKIFLSKHLTMTLYQPIEYRMKNVNENKLYVIKFMITSCKLVFSKFFKKI